VDIYGAGTDSAATSLLGHQLPVFISQHVDSILSLEERPIFGAGVAGAVFRDTPSTRHEARR